MSAIKKILFLRKYKKQTVGMQIKAGEQYYYRTVMVFFEMEI